MTPSPTPPRPTPPAPRPGGAAPGGGGGVTIDPIKLLIRYKWLLLGAGFAGVLIGAVSHFVLLRVYPIYTAEVVFECLPPDADPSQVSPQNVDTEEIERFMGTQVAQLKSNLILNRVLADARLQSEAPKWTKPYMRGGRLDTVRASDDLSDIIRSNAIPNTYLVRLAVSCRYKEDSAGIVRLVKENYLEWLRNANTADVVARKQALKDAIAGANRQLDDLNGRRSRLVRDQGLDTLDGERSQKAESLRLVNYNLLQVQQSLEATQVGLNRDEQQLQRGSGIVYDDTLRMAVDSAPEMLQLKQAINGYEANLSALKAQGILPNHRDFRLLVSQIEGTKQQLEQTRERLLRDAFEARVDQYRLTIRQLQAQQADLVRQGEQLGKDMIELTRIVGEISDIDRTIQTTIELIGKYEADLSLLTTTSGLKDAARVREVQTETVPDAPSFPKIYIMVPLGVILIGGLVTAVIVLLEILDQRVKSAADLVAVGRIPILGIVPDAQEDPAAPEHPESVFRDVPGSVLAEHYRQLRTRVAKAMAKGGHKTLLVVGAMPGSGATSVVSNLGSALVAGGHRVLVVDANYRRPRLNAAFDAPEAPGLSDVLSGAMGLDEAVSRRDGQPDLLSAGSSKRRMVEQLIGGQIEGVLANARDRYDFVLVDVAPAVVSGDAHALANKCDAVMLVVRAMQDKRGMVGRLRNELSECRAEFLGGMVNAVRSAAGGYMRKNIRTSARYAEDEGRKDEAA